MVWENGRGRIERYWDLSYGPKWSYSEEETLERIDELLAETVKLHLLSDVPVGAFLSGGLDSTLIASYAARTLGSELRTFSMGIPYRDLNELPYAAAVAARYGTRHHAEEVTPSVVDDLPRLVSALDEPADPLSICLLHLAKMTARHVKVVLGGDGGDELFGGYDRYAADRWLDGYRAVPEAVRNVVASQVLRRLPDQFTFKSLTHKLRWVDLMARKTGGERYCREPPVLLVQRGAPDASCTPPVSGTSCSARGRTPVCSTCTPRPNAEDADRSDDVCGLHVAPSGSVAHHSRPGHHGLQPGVPLAVPRPPVRRVHGPGPHLDQDPRPPASATSSGGWVSATCRLRCCAGRSRASRRR